MEKLFTFLILCSLSVAATIATSRQDQDAANKWIQKSITRLNEKPDLTLDIYVQDVLGGSGQTVWEVARANITSQSKTGFGLVRVVDDLMTAGPEPNSEKLGRVQGLVTSSDMNQFGLNINLVFVFQSGPFNGSALSVLGRNQFLNVYREMPVVGGTHMFRRASGYVNGSTADSGRADYAVLKYTVNLYH